MDNLSSQMINADSVLNINASTSKRIQFMDIKSNINTDSGSVALVRKGSYCKDEDDIEKKNSTSRGRRSKNVKVTDELRRLVILALEAGTCSRKSAASTFNIPYQTVIKIYKQFLDTGEIVGNSHDTKTNELKTEHVKFILDMLADNCKFTLKDLRELTQNKFGIKIATSLIANRIPTFHYSLKRINDIDVAGVTPEIINDHKEYSELFLQLKDSGRLLVYFDETVFQVTMRRFPEREPLGQQLLGVPPPSVRIRNKTILVSLTQDELLYYKAFDNSNNSVRLLEYLDDLFTILSDRGISGAVLIMGNAAFNHCQEIADVTQIAGHEVIFLPACSPFLNPVENMFTQWTQFVRAKKPGNERELEELIGSFEGIINMEQCQYYCSRAIDNATSCVNRKLIYSK